MNAVCNSNDILNRIGNLVRAAQEGDRDAFGQLFDRYHRCIFGIALRRLKNVDAAEELCQDVFVQAMRKLKQLRAPECFGSWLRSIAVRMAINHQVRRKDLPAVEPTIAASVVFDGEDPAESALRRESESQIHGSLGQLRTMDRETLIAFYLNGQSLVEMAGHFEAPIGTIKRRLHVARKRLAEIVDPA